MRSFIVPLLAAPLALCATPAFAQSNPTAAQIIQSLKPTGNLVAGATRGIRLAAPPAATAAPAAVRPAAVTSAAVKPAAMKPAEASQQVATAKPMQAPEQTAASAPSVNLNVDFATNSADLTPQARATLDRLGQALSSSELAGYHFRIVGHTDTVGTPEYNKTLSEQRADAVVKYLTAKFGVQPTRLQAEGVGEADLLVQTPPQTPERRNRRVEVINEGA